MKLSGRILTPSGFVAGTLHFGETIAGIEADAQAVSAPSRVDRFVVPGFIDVHVHGGDGGDTMDGPAGVEALARFHASHGTTSLLPTTMTTPWPETMRALRGVAEVRARGVTNGPDILGAHLEGPFISPHRLGAQAAHDRPPTTELVEEAIALNVVRLVTLAPELEGALEAARRFARAGVRVSFGHTVGTFEDAQKVAEVVRGEGGTVSGTHLYNAMGPLAGRSPSVLGALLADEEAYSELILDFLHVHPGAFLAARRAKAGKLLLITDAMRAAGRGDGLSELGGQQVLVQGGRATLDNGTLAGSVLTLDVAVRNAVSLGVPLEEAARMASAVPAALLGLADRGHLEAGLRADIVVLNEDLGVEEVYVKGARVC